MKYSLFCIILSISIAACALLLFYKLDYWITIEAILNDSAIKFILGFYVILLIFILSSPILREKLDDNKTISLELFPGEYKIVSDFDIELSGDGTIPMIDTVILYKDYVISCPAQAPEDNQHLLLTASFVEDNVYQCFGFEVVESNNKINYIYKALSYTAKMGIILFPILLASLDFYFITGEGTHPFGNLLYADILYLFGFGLLKAFKNTEGFVGKVYKYLSIWMMICAIGYLLITFGILK